MRKLRRTGRNPIQWFTRTLLMVTALIAVTALTAAALPAQAATAASPLPAKSVPSQFSTSMSTAADGDLTFTLDAGVAYDATTMQRNLDRAQAENSRLSDTIDRQLQEFALGEDASGSADFDGTLSMTSDHTGLSLTIPVGEVQTSETWLQWAFAKAMAYLANWLVVAACALVAPEALVACATIGGFTAGLLRGMLTQYFDGTLGNAKAWAKTFVGALEGALYGFATASVKQWLEEVFPGFLNAVGASLREQAWSWATSAANWVADVLADMAELLPDGFAEWGPPVISASSLPCDIYDTYGTPCAAAHSTVRALYAYYRGPLYQVQRASDQATADIVPLSAGGYADAAAQDSFCADTSCIISKIYDQSPEWNDLTIEGAGGAAGADHGADASALPVTVNGHHVYGVDIAGQTGYRDNTTQGIADNSQSGGKYAEGMYMVASGTHVNSGCCFDYGNAETNTRDTGNGHMDAVNLGTECYFPPCTGSGPWVEADLENGLFSGANGSDTDNAGNRSNFVTAMLKNNGQTTYALKGGDAQNGSLNTWYSGPLPNRGGYVPMHQEGAIVMGTGGDNSNWSVGSFFEGVMTQGYPTDAADAAVQSNIVAAGYDGNSGGTTPVTVAPAGPSAVHDGYSSVYTVNSANGHLQESYLPKMGDPWSTQDLSAKYGTPPVQPGTEPVALIHDGYTSVYTVDASNGHVQETYLPKMGDPWSTQDLSAKYGAPATKWTPTAVVHDGYASVYTVDAANGHVQETYLPRMGDPWSTQDLSAKYGTPPVQAGTSPVALVHSGYTSVYTVDDNHHLQETYLPRMGDPWSTQDLSAKYGTPTTTVTPTAVVHDGYTSVYTVDEAGSTNHLQETYLPKMGDPWSTQDLSAKYGTPPVATGTRPVALDHTGYTSLYTVDQASDHLQETYLPKMGDPWSTQDLSAKYGTASTTETPIPLLHFDESGALTWTSVYTVDQFTSHLRETYLPKLGDSWSTQDLSAKYGTPPVAPATRFPTAGWSVIHDGYTSVYTVDTANDHLQETYLTAMGQPWATQDLSAKYGTPPVMKETAPVTVVHDGYTSVYTVDASNGHLQETYLTAMGQPWATQDLSAKYGTPPTITTPAALVHEGYTSVYTVDVSNGHLRETYLTAMGQPWATQDLSAKYGTPSVASGTAPSAVVHSGWTSVYTVDGSSHDLQETYLPAIGDPWTTQDLSAKYGTPTTTVSPAAAVHDGYTSVYTVDGNHDLQETYLPAMGDSWSTQDLSAKYGTPQVAADIPPVALYHSGYTSVYTVDMSGNHVQETYLPAMSDPWSTQDLSAKYGTPAANQAPSALLHYDTGGGLTWASLFTVNVSDKHLQETYLPAMGDPWATQDLSAKYGTPPV